MSKVILDPVCLIGISTYHEKNLPSSHGASFGLLYAEQKELNYQISMSVPLGVNKNSKEELIQRMIEYENLRTRKSKQTVNYLDQFKLLGWYMIKPSKYLPDQKYTEALIREVSLRGGLYWLILDSQGFEDPKFYKSGKPEEYSNSLQPLEKICSDSMELQKSEKGSAIVKSLQKRKQILTLYNEKLKILNIHLSKPLSGEKKRKIMQVFDLYDRISYYNDKNQKTFDYINYSVLEGLILSKTRSKQ